MTNVTARAAEDAATPRQVFGAALDLVGRLGLVTVLGAIGTLAITRLLGPSRYGGYASAIETAAILSVAADLGFSVMLSRDAAGASAMHRPMLRAAYEVATGWSTVLAVMLVALAVSAGISSERGLVLLVLAPAMAFNGLNPARTFLIVTRRTRLLVAIDAAIMVVQVGASIAVAATGLGPVAVAIAVSGGSIVTNVAVSLAAYRTLAPSSEQRFSRRTLLLRSAPLGVASILTRIYLTIDLVLLGWLVNGPRLGEYAAATKGVTVLARIAGVIMSGALPALATSVARRRDLEHLAARIWHWLVVGPLPVFVALVLFARPILTGALGHAYVHAAPLLRILAVAGCISVLSNLTANLLIVFEKNRAMVIQSAVAIALNVTGNLILIPRIGVVAAAWMTVATEAFVCVSALVCLRREVSFAAIFSTSLRPAAAVAVASAVALALSEVPLVAAPVALATFLVLLSVMSAWPAEFRIGRWASSG